MQGFVQRSQASRSELHAFFKDSGRGAEYTGSQRPTRASAFPVLLKRRYAALLELWRSLDHTSVTTLAVCFPLTWLHILYQFHRSRYQPARHLNDTRLSSYETMSLLSATLGGIATFWSLGPILGAPLASLLHPIAI